MGASPQVTVFQIVESTLGVFFAFAVGFVVVVIGGLIVYESRDSRDFYWLIAAYLPALVLELTFLAWLKNSLERRLFPIAPSLAIRQPRWPWVLRPIAAAWWAVHFLAAGAALLLIEHGLSLQGGSLPQTLMIGAVFLAAQFMLTNSAMLYLLLAVSSIMHDESLIQYIWRKRVAIDLCAMGLAALISYRWPFP